MAFKLDDLAPPGVAARQAESGHGRLGSGVGEAHLVDMGQKGDQHFSHLHLNLQGGRKMGAARHFAGDGFHHFGVGMAQGQRAKGHHPVNVFAPVHIIKPRPCAMAHVTRCAAKGGRAA